MLGPLLISTPISQRDLFSDKGITCSPEPILETPLEEASSATDLTSSPVSEDRGEDLATVTSATITSLDSVDLIRMGDQQESVPVNRSEMQRTFTQAILDDKDTDTHVPLRHKMLQLEKHHAVFVFIRIATRRMPTWEQAEQDYELKRKETLSHIDYVDQLGSAVNLKRRSIFFMLFSLTFYRL